MSDRSVPLALAAAVLLVSPALGASGPRAAPDEEVRVHRLVMAHAVEQGEPVWCDVPFIDDGEPVYAFLEASNPAAVPRRLTITVAGRGRAVRTLSVTLPPRASRHRTWAMLPSGVPGGLWTATVRTASGLALEQVDFEVED